jgi:hypothetical protein
VAAVFWDTSSFLANLSSSDSLLLVLSIKKVAKFSAKSNSHQQDNAKANVFEKMDWKYFNIHLPYSPILTPSNFCHLGLQK